MIRAYGNTLQRFKDGPATYLLPDEKARQRYPFPPQGSPCPHCGQTDIDCHTKNYFYHHKCGTELLNMEPVPWRQTHDAHITRNKVDRDSWRKPAKNGPYQVECHGEGCHTIIETMNHAGTSLCPVCKEKAKKTRQAARNERQRAERAEQKSKLAASSDERAAGCVLRVAEVQSHNKEA